MRAFVLVFVGLGLLFLTIAGGAFLYGTWFRIQAEKVDGAVVEVALRHYADERLLPGHPLFGERRTQLHPLLGHLLRPASYEQGQRVQLYVDRADPERVQLNDFFSIWFLPLLFGFMGTTFTGAGLWARKSRFW